MREDLGLIRQAVREGAWTAFMLTGQIGTKVAGINHRVKVALMMIAVAVVMSIPAWGQQALAACQNRGADKLADFLGQAAVFMMIIGGASALLMFTVGAVMIIFAHNSSRKAKGMDVLKNAVIGLVILAVGVFFKTVVINAVKGLTGGQGTPDGCLNNNGGVPGGGG